MKICFCYVLYIFNAFFLFFIIFQASKALKLSCRASWTCVVLLCQMFMNKTNGLTDDLSEDLILDFVMEACTRTSFLLDVLSQGGIPKVKKMMVYSLESWSVAEDLFTRLPGPMPLVKQWVKVTFKCLKLSVFNIFGFLTVSFLFNSQIECKWNKKLDVDDSPTLYDLLSSSPKLSKRTIGKILQQVPFVFLFFLHFVLLFMLFLCCCDCWIFQLPFFFSFFFQICIGASCI